MKKARKNWYRYGGGFEEELGRFEDPSDESKPHAQALLDILRAADEAGASIAERETMRRIFAGFLSAYNADLLSGDGECDVRKWDGRSPTAERVGPYGSYAINRDGFVDHPYRVRNKKRGGEFYVSEPYQIGEEGLRNLVRLADEGWGVAIRGRLCLHFPGDTVAVCLTPPKR